MAAGAERSTGTRRKRYVVNVAWSISGFIASFVGGILLSPYIIRKLGSEGYGVWALTFAFVEYFWISDLGFRSAVLKYSAHYLARNETEQINRILNTALVYFGLVAVGLIGLTILAAHWADRFFHIPARYQQTFSFLLVLIGASWVIGLIANVFRAALEGFQRYGELSRITITMTVVRVAVSFAVLWAGYGIRALGGAVVGAQVLAYALTAITFWRVFPEFRLAPALVTRDTFRQMMGYGAHTMVSVIAMQLIVQTPVLLIGRLRSVIEVGYYSLPTRLLASLSDAVSQVGMVTGASSADLSARGKIREIVTLGTYVNRYCLTLFMPLTILFWFYSTELFRIWVGPDMAQHSAPLLPVMATGVTLAIAAQQNSSAILFGVGAHARYAWGLMVEGAISLAVMVWVLPRYGVIGVAWVAAVLMILDRGIWAPWLVCRNTGADFVRYMRSVYAGPLLAAIPAVAAAAIAKHFGLRPEGWSKLALAGAIIASAYGIGAWFLCIERPHRALLWSMLQEQTVARRRAL